MLRRFLPWTGLAVLMSLSTPKRADAAGALLPSTSATPIEQRIAVALGPTRTTVWTSLRLQTQAGPVGIVVPVPPGATLAHSSDAWFEALDAATAPRVFPPAGASPYCSGDEPPMGTPDPFHVTSDLGHAGSADGSMSSTLPDVAAVAAWATEQGLILSPEVASALEAMPNMRFFTERFESGAGAVLTKTLRVVLPGQTPVLPLALARAGASDLRVTTFLIGTGSGALAGAEPITLPTSALHWVAANGASNYVELRQQELLKAGPSAVLIETASHDALLKNLSIANGTSSITGVVRGYFERAATYGDGNALPSPCITAAGVALDSVYPVATSCPRADLGVVDGAPSCAEAPAGAEVNPALLRCGGMTDDLAVALSGLVPSTTWLTRATMIVPKSGTGSEWPLSFEGSFSTVDPRRTASSIDLATCGGSSSSTGSSGSGGPSGSSSGGQGTSGGVTVGAGAGGYDPGYEPDVGCACAGTADPVIIDEVGGSGGSGGSGGDAYVDDTSSDDCSGDTTDSSSDSSSDDCSGDTTDTEADTSSDDCSGDTTDTEADTSSDDCSGDTTDSSTDSSSDDCSGDTTDSSTDSSSDDCSGDTTDSGSDTSSSAKLRAPASRGHERTAMTAAPKPKSPHTEALRVRKRGPKLSAFALGLLAILAPLRRLARPVRKPRSHRRRS